MGTGSLGLTLCRADNINSDEKDQLNKSVGLFDLEIYRRPQLKTKCGSDCAN